MKVNHFFNMIHTLSYAVKAHTEGDTAVARGYVDMLKHDCQMYLNEMRQTQYQSIGGDRPDGWLTVVEYLEKYDPEFFNCVEDLAAETSSYGVKASRHMKAEGLTPVSLPKPPCFADDDHFETVKCYPEYVLERSVS